MIKVDKSISTKFTVSVFYNSILSVPDLRSTLCLTFNAVMSPRLLLLPAPLPVVRVYLRVESGSAGAPEVAPGPRPEAERVGVAALALLVVHAGLEEALGWK